MVHTRRKVMCWFGRRKLVQAADRVLLVLCDVYVCVCIACMKKTNGCCLGHGLSWGDANQTKEGKEGIKSVGNGMVRTSEEGSASKGSGLDSLEGRVHFAAGQWRGSCSRLEGEG